MPIKSMTYAVRCERQIHNPKNDSLIISTQWFYSTIGGKLSGGGQITPKEACMAVCEIVQDILDEDGDGWHVTGTGDPNKSN